MIHRFRVKNFKSLRDVTVHFEPVTLLVGRSGSGKSNFLDSIRFFSNLLLVPDWTKQRFRNNFSTVCHASGNSHPLSFEIEFSVNGIENRFVYELEFSRSVTDPRLKQDLTPKKLTERLLLGDKTLFHQKEGEWHTNPPTGVLPTLGQIAIGSFPSVSEIVIAFTALTTGIGCHRFSDSVLTNGKYEISSAGLSNSADNYLSVLQDITKNLQDLKIRKSMIATLQRINPSVMSVELDSVQTPSKVIVGHRFTDDSDIISLQLEQESAGFRRFYAYLLALYQRPPKQTLLFEHPEDGIHPGAMSLLAEEIQATPNEHRGQIVLTTHNPRLLDYFSSSQIRVVELIGDATQIGKLSTEQRESLDEQLLEPGELLTTDPARIDLDSLEPTP
jgi:predicted ATP-dependent endonuclease of OLD family